MSGASQIAVSGLNNIQLRTKVETHNMANSLSAGYDRMEVLTSDGSYSNIQLVGSQTGNSTILPSGIQDPHGSRIVAMYRVFAPHQPIETGNTYDLFCDNTRNYFQVLDDEGNLAYSKAGVFTMDNNRQMVTHDGYILQPAITIPQEAVDVQINNFGDVIVTLPGNATPQVIGRIHLASFNNPGGLKAGNRGYFYETNASGTGTLGDPGKGGYGSIMQGFHSDSNVNMVSSMTNMVDLQRNYEVLINAIKIDMRQKDADVQIASA